MDLPSAIGPLFVVALLGWLVVRRIRAIALERANVRVLQRRLFFRKARFFPWPIIKVLWRGDSDLGVIIEHHSIRPIHGLVAANLTRVGFFGSSCIPAADWERLNVFVEAEGFTLRFGGFRAVLENTHTDLVVASVGFGEIMELWMDRFLELNAAHASTPHDAACGACGLPPYSEVARCACGAIYHQACAEAAGGECFRWGCLSVSMGERPRRLVEALHARMLPYR